MEVSVSGRVLYGSRPPKSFIEESEFNFNNPYFVRVKHLAADDHTPPHYSKDTIEILLCSGVTGNISISQSRFELTPEQNAAFVIPPDTVHSTFFTVGSTVLILQISLPNICHLIDFSSMLELINIRVADLLYSEPRYEQLYPLFCQLIEQDNNPFVCYRTLISIMEILCGELKHSDERPGSLSEHSSLELKKVIAWTSENYSKQVTLDMVAKLVCMSRTYFCSWFKSKANMTYSKYLNQVRISYAVRLLASGRNTTSTAYDCGFTNVSYFIQVFKKIQGCTPKEFSGRCGH